MFNYSFLWRVNVIGKRLLYLRQFRAACIVGVVFANLISSSAQNSRWADPNDPTAKYMIDLEHQWTDADCNRSMIVETLLADDFLGTSPQGKLDSKQEAVERSKSGKEMARSCQTYEVKVHFFGDNVALLYGSESAIWKTAAGTEHTRKLIWTDTWLKRNGKWQIVAAQDMPAEDK
jgi:hypothetical protein